MEMVSLKREKMDMEEEQKAMPMENEYGWGTCIRLEGDVVQKLGLQGVTAGEKVEVMGMGYIQSVSSCDDAEGKRMEVSIQLTEMGASKKSDMTRTAGGEPAFNYESMKG